MAKKWYCLEIEYVARDNQVKLFRIPNMDSVNMQRFRENVFAGGAYRRVDDCTGEIIPPYRITAIDVYWQSHFFTPDEEDKPLKKWSPKTK